MTEEKTNYLSIGIWITIGAIIAYVIFKNNKPQTLSLQPTNNLDELKYLFNNRLDNLERKINLLNQPVQQIKPDELESIKKRLDNTENITTTQPIRPAQPEMIKVQDNEETLDFKTDDKGRILGASFHRSLFVKQ